MATPREKLAQSLEELKKFQDDQGIAIVKPHDLNRTHLDRLVSHGFLIRVIKGWYISARLDEKPGSTTSWYTSFWQFVYEYATNRFDGDWCLSPEQSLLFHSGNYVVPRQLLIRSPRAHNNITTLIHGTSILDLTTDIPDVNEIIQIKGINLYSIPSALINSGSEFFVTHPIDARTCIASIKDTSDILRILLDGGHSTIAGRLSGAFRNIGRSKLADDILSTMKSVGYDVRENDPFEEKTPVLISKRVSSLYVNRIKLMWHQMRQRIISQFPSDPGLPDDREQFLKTVDEIYVSDAYHSLSIEGYSVTEKLIERVRSGDWDPEVNEVDREMKDALAARGYWQTFQMVKDCINQVLTGEDPGEIVDQNHTEWYRELFAPSVKAGILKTSDLAGYRNTQVYISSSMHTPPNKEAVRDLMPVLFDLLRKEESGAVRAVLGHFIFVYIHPFIDGNGRIARFIMNVMLASAGYNWTIIKNEERKRYMMALEEASVNSDISSFTDLISDLVNEHPST